VAAAKRWTRLDEHFTREQQLIRQQILAEQRKLEQLELGHARTEQQGVGAHVLGKDTTRSKAAPSAAQPLSYDYADGFDGTDDEGDRQNTTAAHHARQPPIKGQALGGVL
jgi:hypothetical protein